MWNDCARMTPTIPGVRTLARVETLTGNVNHLEERVNDLSQRLQQSEETVRSLQRQLQDLAPLQQQVNERSQLRARRTTSWQALIEAYPQLNRLGNLSAMNSQERQHVLFSEIARVRGNCEEMAGRIQILDDSVLREGRTVQLVHREVQIVQAAASSVSESVPAQRARIIEERREGRRLYPQMDATMRSVVSTQLQLAAQLVAERDARMSTQTVLSTQIMQQEIVNQSLRDRVTVDAFNHRVRIHDVAMYAILGGLELAVFGLPSPISLLIGENNSWYIDTNNFKPDLPKSGIGIGIGLAFLHGLCALVYGKEYAIAVTEAKLLEYFKLYHIESNNNGKLAHEMAVAFIEFVIAFVSKPGEFLKDQFESRLKEIFYSNGLILVDKEFNNLSAQHWYSQKIASAVYEALKSCVNWKTIASVVAIEGVKWGVKLAVGAAVFAGVEAVGYLTRPKETEEIRLARQRLEARRQP